MERAISTDRLKKNRLPSLLILVGVFLLIFGQAAAQQYKIIDIRVSGNVHVSEKTIRNAAALKIGTDLTGAALQDAVKSLYAKGVFRDIVVDVEQVTAGVVIIIKVSEYPKLSGINFKGNKKIKDKELKKLLELAVGGYINDHLVVQSGSKIESEYISKGYFMAEIDAELKYAPDSANAELTFNIREYNKVKVERVVLTGNKQLKADDLIKKISNRKRGLFRSSDFKKEKFPEDKEKIIEYCRKKGFIDAYIVSDSSVVDTVRNRMTIYINIYEGPKYYFGESSFAGNEIYTDEDLGKTLKFKSGQVFNQEKYEESLGELYGAYQEEGYLHIRILDQIQTADSTVNIDYDITEGLPSEVRLIEITGNTKTKEKVIRREMLMRPGMTFRRSILMRSLRDITQLNYFSDVVPDVRDLPSGDVDLIIKVEEKPTAQVSAGAGYSGQDKLVGTFGLGIPNFRGNGQNVNISVDFGSRRSSISLSFTEPWFMGTPTLVGFEIYNLDRRWYDDFTEGRRGGSLRLGRRLRWPDNYFRVYWRYRLESVKYHDFDEAYLTQNGETVINSYGETVYRPFENSLMAFNEEWLRTSAMSFTVERDSRDLPIFATSGAQIAYTGEVSGGILGGRWEYYKHLFVASKYIPLIWGAALVGSSKFGYISTKDNDLIPYSERFSPGGVDPDGTVRGYPDASLSPRSSTGSILGGMSEVIYDAQIQLPIVKGQMYGLIFADAGTAWLSRKEIRPFSHLYKSVGVGFRLIVPSVGVIGFDFGYALDELRGEKKGWRPHFQISPGY